MFKASPDLIHQDDEVVEHEKDGTKGGHHRWNVIPTLPVKTEDR